MFQGINDSDKSKLILAAINAGVIILVYLVFKYCLVLVAPFLIGIIITLAIRRPIYFLKRKFRIPLPMGTVIVLFMCLVAVAWFVVYVGSRFVLEVKSFLANYELYYGIAVNRICDVCYHIDEMFGFANGKTYEMVENGIVTTVNKAADEMIPVVVEKSLNVITSMVVWGGGIIIVFTVIFFAIRDIDRQIQNVKSGPYGKWFNIIFGKLSYFGGAYIKTQLIIMCITGVICTAAMFIIGNGYPIMVGILIGLLDALPFFGTGTVLIPWTLLSLVTGNFIKAAVIFTAYCLCYVIREILEPRLMGGHMGIHPLIMLITMYAGILLFGILGFILGPAAYIITSEIMKYLRQVI